ncbi:uncharacterized protein MONBRDRAFT_22748 [Monosiga brevicollis MX1]|uniref:Uncharacterized protein n=1 Tax=Monosiga brevicollis TaxID=81824 RepID=A9URY7_MONBE|nr:uncharacterized protein MONBRDRAFT_22748 [Monosiga brevicollis MX1]EDQ92008.1 predicted protein [Monosiga brevicollis MX1]|eukprot:XP_001743294.1 hypothetical protein [Monosiga brevicollis MX1]
MSADLSGRQLRSLQGVPDLDALVDSIPTRELRLSNNLLVDLSSLELTLQHVTTLDLRHNRLRSLQGIAHLPNVVDLNLAHNQLRSLAGVERLPRLRQLNASYNALRSLHSLASAGAACPELSSLCLHNNHIQPLADLGWLAGLIALRKLRLRDRPDRQLQLQTHGNTVCDQLNYASTIIATPEMGSPIFSATRLQRRDKLYRHPLPTVKQVRFACGGMRANFTATLDAEQPVTRTRKRQHHQLPCLLTSLPAFRPGLERDDEGNASDDQTTSPPVLLSRSPTLLPTPNAAAPVTKGEFWRLRAAHDSVEQLLGKELAAERQRRHDAETAMQDIKAQLQHEQHRSSSTHSRHAQAVATIKRLEQSLTAASLRIDELTAARSQLRDQCHRGEDRVEKLLLQLESQQRQQREEAAARHTMSEKLLAVKEEMQELKMSQVDRIKGLEIELSAAVQEADRCKRAERAARRQVSQLQELLAEKETANRTNKENLVRLDGPEVELKLQRIEADARDRELGLERQWRERVDFEKERYRQLEQEFQAALQYEGSRHHELETAYRDEMHRAHQLQSELSVYQAKVDEAADVTMQLTRLVEEQRAKLHQQQHDLDEATQSLGRCTQEMQRHREVEAVAVGKADELARQARQLQTKLTAQESIIHGLREERNLWSKELAEQGASLSANRGKLESQLQAALDAAEAIKAERGRLDEALRIKTKVAEDQSETIKNLRVAVAEKERVIDRLRDDLKEQEAEWKDRLSKERDMYETINGELQTAQAKKSDLKAAFSDLKKEYDLALLDNERLRTPALNSRPWNIELAACTSYPKCVCISIYNRPFYFVTGQEHETQLANLNNDITELQRVLDAERTEHAEVKTSLMDQLRQSRLKQEQLNAALQDAGTELQEAERSLTSLQQELTALQAERDRAQRNADLKLARMKQLMAELANEG